MVRKLEQYLAEEARQKADDRNLVSRTEERREKQRVEAELFALATKLTELKPSHLERLQLPEHLLTILDELRIIENLSARNRATKRLRAELRDVDAKGLSRRIAALTEPGASKPLDAAGNWSQKLASGGDRELDEFLGLCPDADRAQLRNLLRNVRRAKPEELKRAASRLVQALRVAMRSAAPREGAEASASRLPTTQDPATDDISET